MQCFIVLGVETQHQARRGVGGTHQSPTVGPVGTQAVDGRDACAVELGLGQNLEIRLQAVGETTDDGEVKVFFELNGQPRVIRVPNRAIKAKTAAKPKAMEGNPAHIGAPMPGSIASVAVVAGQKVNAGDLLLTIEAMKMETGIHADRDGTIKAVHVSAGSQIDAKDLLVELE